jgi:hypothetical protein
VGKSGLPTLVKEWDSDVEAHPAVIYIPTMKQMSPDRICLLRGDLTRSYSMLDPLNIASVNPLVGALMYDLSAYSYVSWDVAFGDCQEEDLYVVPHILIAGWSAATFAKPQLFEIFTIGLNAKPKSANTGASRERVSPSALQKLREEYPWIRDDDIERAFTFSCSKPASTNTDPADKADAATQPPDADVDVGKVMAGLAEIRAHWDWHGEEGDDHFYVWQRGGGSTAKKKGVATDCASANARAASVDWCNRFTCPKMKSFAFSEHTLDGANEMAREWC